MDRARRDRGRAVHGRPRRGDRERRPSVDQDRPRLQPGEPPVDRHRLRDHVRRRAPARRADVRPARAPAAVHGRPGALHGQLAAGRHRLVVRIADRVPGPPGSRRSAAVAGSTLDPDDHVPRGTRAERRARRLGRGLRKRRRRGRPARRRSDRLARLVVDLLHQHPGRHRTLRGQPVAAAREPGPPRPPALRRPRCGLDHRRADAARLRADSGDAGRAGERSPPSASWRDPPR